MKQIIILLAFVLACSTTLHAQNLTINNNVWGDVYVTAYAYQQSSCVNFIDNTVPTLVTAGNSIVLDLTLNSSWASATVPGTAYDIVWATVSRDPSCTGTMPWGSIAGTCWSGGNVYFDEATIGDPACLFSLQACIAITLSSSASCLGFFHGDAIGAVFTPGGMNATVDINP